MRVEEATSPPRVGVTRASRAARPPGSVEFRPWDSSTTSASGVRAAPSTLRRTPIPGTFPAPKTPGPPVGVHDPGALSGEDADEVVAADETEDD